jgi:molecular chaperone GrpE
MSDRIIPEQEEPKAAGDGTDQQAENAALNDRLLRALAEVENTRRRAERDTGEARQYAVANFARQLLEIVDNLDRAIAAAEIRSPGQDCDAPLIEGVQATQRMLMAMLERFGIRKIDALGVPFDPTLHEAIMEVDDTSQAPGSVVDVLQDGYTIHDRLLRPARVVVAKRRSDQTTPDTSTGVGIEP